jgi:hypothetical protein
MLSRGLNENRPSSQYTEDYTREGDALEAAKFHRTEAQGVTYYHSFKRCRLSQGIIIVSFSSIA